MVTVVVLLCLLPIIACSDTFSKGLLRKVGKVCSEKCAPQILAHARFSGDKLPVVPKSHRGTAFHCALLKAMLIDPDIKEPSSESTAQNTVYLNEFFLTRGRLIEGELSRNWSEFTEFDFYEERLKLLPKPIREFIVRHEKKHGLRRSLDLFHITDLESFIYWAPCFLDSDLINGSTTPKDFVELDQFFNKDTTLSKLLLTNGAFDNFSFPTINIKNTLLEHESIDEDDSSEGIVNVIETSDESSMEMANQPAILSTEEMQLILKNLAPLLEEQRSPLLDRNLSFILINLVNLVGPINFCSSFNNEFMSQTVGNNMKEFLKKNMDKARGEPALETINPQTNLTTEQLHLIVGILTSALDKECPSSLEGKVSTLFIDLADLVDFKEKMMDDSQARSEATMTSTNTSATASTAASTPITPQASPSIAIGQKRKSTEMFVEERSPLLDRRKAPANPIELIDSTNLAKENLLAQTVSAINLIVVQVYSSYALWCSIPTRYMDPRWPLHDVNKLRHTIQTMHFSGRRTGDIKAAIGEYVLEKIESGEILIQSGVIQLSLRNNYYATLHVGNSSKLRRLAILDCRYDIISLLKCFQQLDDGFEKALFGNFFDVVQFLHKYTFDGTEPSLARLSVLYEYLVARPNPRASKLLKDSFKYTDSETSINLVCNVLLPTVEELHSEEELEVFLEHFVLSIILVANGYDRVLDYQKNKSNGLTPSQLQEKEDRCGFLHHKHQAVLEQIKILASVPAGLLAANKVLNSHFTELQAVLLENINDPTTMRNLLNSFLYELKDNQYMTLDLHLFDRKPAENVNNYLDKHR